MSNYAFIKNNSYNSYVTRSKAIGPAGLWCHNNGFPFFRDPLSLGESPLTWTHGPRNNKDEWQAPPASPLASNFYIIHLLIVIVRHTLSYLKKLFVSVMQKYFTALMPDYALNAMIWLFYALTYVRIWLNNWKKGGSEHLIIWNKFYPPIMQKYFLHFLSHLYMGFWNFVIYSNQWAIKTNYLILDLIWTLQIFFG